MAAANISVDQEQFICAVCLTILNDPVTTPCGHSFCKVCINDCWDHEDVKGVYSCPYCRDTFPQRPVLRRNNMLAEVMQKLKESEHQPAHCSTGPGNVECCCTGRKRKACFKHHYPPAFKKQTLVKAFVEPQGKICSQHGKLIEVYCRNDQRFICYLCKMDEHKNHDTVPAKTERTQKQNELLQEQIKYKQRIQENQKKVQELKQTVGTIKMCSREAVDETERIFTELISSMKKRRLEAKKLIRDQEKAKISQAERLLAQLEKETANLKERITQLEQLSHTDNHIHFLQTFRSLCVSPGCEDSPSFTVNQPLSFQGLKKSLSDLKKQMEEMCEEAFNKIHPHDFCTLTLDPNTAHRELILSQRNKAVTFSDTDQRYSDHPERFDFWTQILCKESVHGRCYWEVEWSGSGVEISVSYKEIMRKGESFECAFGCNTQSWSLACSSSSVSFWHNRIETGLQGSASSRIGVYVDHKAGTLSFYSVSDTMRLLHRVHTIFTQPLYAGFRFCSYNSTVRLCDQKLNVGKSLQ